MILLWLELVSCTASTQCYLWEHNEGSIIWKPHSQKTNSRNTSYIEIAKKGGGEIWWICFSFVPADLPGELGTSNMVSRYILQASLIWLLTGKPRHHCQRLSPHLSRCSVLWTKRILGMKAIFNLCPKGEPRLYPPFFLLGTLFLSRFLCNLENHSPSDLESSTTHPLYTHTHTQFSMPTTKPSDFSMLHTIAVWTRLTCPGTQLCFLYSTEPSNQDQHILQRD